MRDIKYEIGEIEPKEDFEREMEKRFAYQFETHAKGLFKDVRASYSRTGRLRRLFKKGELFAVFRSDGIMIPQRAMAKEMPPIKFVEVEEELVGKSSILTPGIREASPDVRPGEVVEIRVNGKRAGMGIARLSSREMKEIGGEAVKVKYWI